MGKQDYSDTVKATPEGIVYQNEAARSLFVPFLREVVAALLADENWNRATSTLSGSQCLDEAAWELFNRSQEDVTYDDSAAQYAYLLKYMPFYAAEYDLMYQDIAGLLSDHLWDEGISVCSIGAGNLVDYWSFARAFANWGQQHKKDTGAAGSLGAFMRKLSYLGIDRAPWSYPFTFLDCHANTCKARYGLDIADEAAAAEVAEFNPLICFFPKSLNEFDEGAVKAVSKIIAHSTRPRTYVAVSLPAAREGDSFCTEAAAKKISKLRDVLRAEGCIMDQSPVREHAAGTELDAEQACSSHFADNRWLNSIQRPIWNKCDAEKHPHIKSMSAPGYLNWQVFACAPAQSA